MPGDNQEDLDSSNSREEECTKIKIANVPRQFHILCYCFNKFTPFFMMARSASILLSTVLLLLHSMPLDLRYYFFTFPSPSVSALHILIFLVQCVLMITNPIIVTLDSLCHLSLPSSYFVPPFIAKSLEGSYRMLTICSTLHKHQHFAYLFIHKSFLSLF